MSDNPFRNPPHAPPPDPTAGVSPAAATGAENLPGAARESATTGNPEVRGAVTGTGTLQLAGQEPAGSNPEVREAANPAVAGGAETLARAAQESAAGSNPEVRGAVNPAVVGGAGTLPRTAQELVTAGNPEMRAAVNSATAGGSETLPRTAQELMNAGNPEVRGAANPAVAGGAETLARAAQESATAGNPEVREAVDPAVAGAPESAMAVGSSPEVRGVAAEEGLNGEPVSLPPTVTEVQAGWYNPAEPGKADQPPTQAGWRKAPELVPAPPPFVEQQPAVQLQPAPPPMMGPSRSWMALFSGLAWIVLCFELGAFLLVYPWMDGWDQNYFATLQPAWHDVWVNPWIRGAVSGLGTVNILIALIELFRYLRHWLFD